MVRLPVSGLEAAPRAPDGSDELMLREAAGSPTAVAISLAERLAGPGDWGALPVTDFEVLMLAIRARAMGEEISLGLTCPNCGAAAEISFATGDFLAGLAPRTPPAVTPDPERPGWNRLGAAAFRLPTAHDQAAVSGRLDAALAMAERCLDPPRPGAALRGRVERAMAAMAPEVSRPAVGACPDCGAAVEAPIHVTRLVVAELTREAGALYDDIALIAETYHWSEADILAMPRRRRQAYTERIRLSRGAAA